HRKRFQQFYQSLWSILRVNVNWRGSDLPISATEARTDSHLAQRFFYASRLYRQFLLSCLGRPSAAVESLSVRQMLGRGPYSLIKIPFLCFWLNSPSGIALMPIFFRHRLH